MDEEKKEMKEVYGWTLLAAIALATTFVRPAHRPVFFLAAFAVVFGFLSAMALTVFKN